MKPAPVTEKCEQEEDTGDTSRCVAPVSTLSDWFFRLVHSLPNRCCGGYGPCWVHFGAFMGPGLKLFYLVLRTWVCVLMGVPRHKRTFLSTTPIRTTKPAWFTIRGFIILVNHRELGTCFSCAHRSAGTFFWKAKLTST